MREVDVGEVRREVEALLRHAAHSLPEDYLAAMRSASREEQSPTGQQVIELLLENAAYADVGNDPHLSGHGHGDSVRQGRAGGAFQRR